MSDLIDCRKCGKPTNKYAPVCLHCGAALVRETPPPIEPEKGRPPEETSAMARLAVPRHKKCPFCAEEIQYEAIKCKFCGELIKEDKKKPSRPVRPYLAPAILIILSAAGIISAVVFLAGAVRYDKALGTFSIKFPARSDNVSEKDYIKKFVTLSGIGTLEEMTTKSVTPVKYAYGTVKNSGDRTVNKIKVAVYYLDKNGKRVGDDSAWSAFGTTARPDSLKPDGSKDFKILIADINPAWSGKIRAEVVDIEFLD